MNYAVLGRSDFGTYEHIESKFYWLRRSARSRGIPMLLTKKQLGILLRSTTDSCQCCKNPFGWTQGDKRFPSLDRIDPDGPYDMSNVRVICSKCNNTKGALERNQMTAKRMQASDSVQVSAWMSEVWVTNNLISSFGG